MRGDLIVGIKGHLARIRKHDGFEVWRKRVRGRSPVAATMEGDKIFAYAKGHLYALSVTTGAVLWENHLPNLGFGPCVIANAGQDVGIAVQSISIDQTTLVVTALGGLLTIVVSLQEAS